MVAQQVVGDEDVLARQLLGVDDDGGCADIELGGLGAGAGDRHLVAAAGDVVGGGEPGLVAIDALHARAVGPVDEIDRARALDDARRQLEGAPGDGAVVAGEQRAVGVVAVAGVLGAGHRRHRMDAGAAAQRGLAEAGAIGVGADVGLRSDVAVGGVGDGDGLGLRPGRDCRDRGDAVQAVVDEG